MFIYLLRVYDWPPPFHKRMERSKPFWRVYFVTLPPSLSHSLSNHICVPRRERVPQRDATTNLPRHTYITRGGAKNKHRILCSWEFRVERYPRGKRLSRVRQYFWIISYTINLHTYMVEKRLYNKFNYDRKANWKHPSGCRTIVVIIIIIIIWSWDNVADSIYYLVHI